MGILVKLAGYGIACLLVLFLIGKMWVVLGAIKLQEYIDFMQNAMVFLPFVVVGLGGTYVILRLLACASSLMNRPLPPTIAFKLNVDAKARRIVCEEGGVFTGFRDYGMRVRIPRGHERTWFRRFIRRQFFHTDLPEDAVNSLGLVKDSSRVKLTRILEEC